MFSLLSMNLFQPTKGDFIAVGVISILAGAVIGFIINIGYAVLKQPKVRWSKLIRGGGGFE